MEETKSRNRIILCGIPLTAPVFSHENRAERFFSFPLEVLRLSGTADRIRIVVRERMLSALCPDRNGFLEIRGELRSFHNRSGEGARLVITVFARELLTPPESRWENRAELTGTLCRTPVFRSTPMGREIADLLLSVERPYGRRDYLPCIVWGRNARAAAEWDAGSRVYILGRV